MLSGTYHFKMTEMAGKPERLERIPAFYRVIENHVLCSISIAYNQKDLERAKRRIFLPNSEIDWGFLNNSYLFAFRGLMDMFHNKREEIKNFILLEDTVDFIFDKQNNEENQILSMWSEYMSERPGEILKHFGSTPIFMDDKKFLPIQAADLWAWWVRKWTEEGTIEENMDNCDFGTWKADRVEHIKIHITFDEEQILTASKEILVNTLKPGHIIYDLRPSLFFGKM